MNILLVSTQDSKGGAARAMLRLHHGLRHSLHESHILAYYRQQSDTHRVGQHDWVSLSVRASVWANQRATHGQTTPDCELFSTNLVPNALHRRIAQLNPDVLHLHWIAGGFLPISRFSRLKKPIVWTLHDMWAFTGGCHYTQGCTRYQHTCGNCPQLRHAHTHDLSQRVFHAKVQEWREVPMTIITPSQWLARCVRESALLGHQRIEVIPNGINTRLYQPLDRATARQAFGLPQHKRLIVFGALNSTTTPRKGFDALKHALRALKTHDTELVIFGAKRPQHTLDFGLPTHYLGNLQDDISLALAYNTADVFVAPSLQDNLPNTVLEALACGVPCVAFNIGGMSDLITHQHNGYLAQANNTDDLAQGIEWVLAQDRALLSQQARETIIRGFALEKIVERHIALYESLP
jgi:glycosyltransferase involved in cell wall biosynthesis